MKDKPFSRPRKPGTRTGDDGGSRKDGPKGGYKGSNKVGKPRSDKGGSRPYAGKTAGKGPRKDGEARSEGRTYEARGTGERGGKYGGTSDRPEKAGRKPYEKSFDKPARRSGPRRDDAESYAEKRPGKKFDKPFDKKSGDRPGKSFDKKPGRTFGDKPGGKFGDKAGGRPAGKYGKRSDAPRRDDAETYAEKRPGKPYEKKFDRKSGDKFEKSYDRKPERSFGDKPDGKFGDRAGGRPAGKYGKRSDAPRRDDAETYEEKRPGRSFDKKPFDKKSDKKFDKPFEKKFDRKPGGKFGDKTGGKYGDRPSAAGRKPWQDRDARPPQPDVKGLNANLWGVHAVEEAWLNPARHVEKLYVTETALESFEKTREKAAELGLKRPEPFMLDRKTLDRILPPGAVHQGLAIDAVPLDELFAQDLLARALVQDRATILILDQLTDPHNVGAIMRSASAFGATGIIMQSRHSPEITGVLAKSACGAVEHMPIAYETNLGRALTLLQENGFTAIGLDERGTVTLAEIEKPAKAVLILGAEGKGLRQHLRDQCDVLARLPTQGAIQSLNVSNAAAVALYALL